MATQKKTPAPVAAPVEKKPAKTAAKAPADPQQALADAKAAQAEAEKAIQTATDAKQYAKLGELSATLEKATKAVTTAETAVENANKKAAEDAKKKATEDAKKKPAAAATESKSETKAEIKSEEAPPAGPTKLTLTGSGKETTHVTYESGGIEAVFRSVGWDTANAEFRLKTGPTTFSPIPASWVPPKLGLDYEVVAQKKVRGGFRHK